MIKTGAIVAAAGLLSCSAGAWAADLPTRTAPPVFTQPILVGGWEGPYVGSTYGYSFTNFSTKQGSSRSKGESGQTGGALIGYNFQTGHFVYGGEGDIDLNVVRGNIAGNGGLTSSHVDSLYDIRFRGRLGYEFGWFMPFVAGGAVLNETYQSGITPNYFGDVRRSVGYTVGGGVDFKVNPSRFFPGAQNSVIGTFLGPMVLRLEYLHDDLPTTTFRYGGQSYRTSSDSNIIRASIISRFGDNPPRPYADSAGNVNWAGAYGGLIGGGGFFTPRTKAAGLASTHFDTSGGLGGIYAGTNFIFYNHYMLGFDGSTAFTDITGSGPEPASSSVKFRNYVEADLRGRAGYAFGNYLPFVAAGILYGRSEQTDRVTGSERGRVNSEAFTVGAGLDYRVTERVSLRGEYLYASSFNNKTVNLNNCGNCKQDFDGNIFRVGAAYHFE